ncbi:AAA family ATPase [Oerskovia flava]|uniref:AAA family ATPase n=1 Tax=Oerskovia flava TaxID=2986422 RepID=UPI00223F9FC8|nr:AAA family ATPase [Oerskovia sp. JB1-3-2]
MTHSPAPPADEDSWFSPDTYDDPGDSALSDRALEAFVAATGLAADPQPAIEDDAEPPLFADVAALLDGTMPEPPRPSLMVCSDGAALFYRGQLNHIYGDPESGKTWVCLAAAATDLDAGRRAAVIDVDHNGVASTVHRLLDLGAPAAALRDPDRFRYAEPEDGAQLVQVVRALAEWTPDTVVLDSLGEVLPMFGASSNSPDDFTRVHGLVMKPLARSGAAVLVIDHLAKGESSRAMGATGTAAKKRAIGGVSLRVTVGTAFAPGRGGSCYLAISKDRHGGLRQHRAGAGDKEPLAAVFRLNDDTTFALYAPKPDDRDPALAASAEDVAAVAALDPPPTAIKEARERLGWNMQRTVNAMRDWRQSDRS